MYDLNKEKILHECTELEYDLLKFLESNEIHSLQRWLLTCSNDEVETLSKIADKISREVGDEDDTFLIPMIIMINDGIESFNIKLLTKITNDAIISITLIDLVKKGLLKYKMVDNDEDWIFSIPTNLRDDLKKELNI